MTQRRQRPKNTKTTGVVTLAILPKEKWLLPMGKQLFVCDQFPQGEFASGEIFMDASEEQQNRPTSIN